MGKKFPCISQGMKKIELINRLFKIFKNYAPNVMCIFQNYVLGAKLCDFASPHNSGSPVYP